MKDHCMECVCSYCERLGKPSCPMERSPCSRCAGKPRPIYDCRRYKEKAPCEKGIEAQIVKGVKSGG